MFAVFAGKTRYMDDLASYLQLEQKYFQDTLLGNEIPAEDSYYTLHVKSRLFMQWALNLHHHSQDILSSNSPTPLRYVVMIDDDVYLRLPLLVMALLSGPGARDYRGEVRHICTMQCNAMRCITIKIILFSVCSSCILLLIYIYTHRVNLILQLTRCLLCMSNV